MSFPISFDPLTYHYASRRNVVYGRNGMVCTGNPLAAQAGLDVLRKGGNAIDAAVAAASSLTVVEPTANGIGSDAFAIVYTGGKLYGLNSSGPSPRSISLEEVRGRGFEKMPEDGVIPVNVPGAPGAWAALSERFGRMPLKESMATAIGYAEDGYPIQPGVGEGWKASFERCRKAAEKFPEVNSWFETFAPDGRPLKVGELLRLPGHARTLRAIAETNAEEFYRGGLADEIDRFMKQYGGFLSKEDLAAFYPEWVQPLTTDYHGFTVCEIPPNGHGITVLMALNILKGLPETSDLFTQTHRQIEAMKLAFTDAQRYVADPGYMTVSPDQLLSEEYAAARRALIGTEAITPEYWEPVKGGTVYLCTADREGNMVSYIQSNYMGFGSGVVIPGTGISLNNRGANFYLDSSMANCLGPAKKSYHTIIPGFLMKDGRPVGPFGIMGGFMQPQAHLQVLMSAIDHHLNPQDALDKPRWMWTGGKTIEVEQSFDAAILGQLARAGHNIVVRRSSVPFGRGEIIWRSEDGILCGGCEMRTDGQVAAW